MLDIFLERFRQKRRTVPYPKALPGLPPRFRGRPVIDAARCAAQEGCTACVEACPLAAISLENGLPALDTGLCSFCGECALACQKRQREQALLFTTDWRIASSSREALLVKPLDLSSAWMESDKTAIVQSFPEPQGPLCGLDIQALPAPVVTPFAGGEAFARSFRLRQVSAAGCGACEADLNVLGTVVFDLPRFGIDFVASPRHADALVITGPVPRNMREALRLTDQATPKPRAIIAVGACAISGGLFRALPNTITDRRARQPQPDQHGQEEQQLQVDQLNVGTSALMPVDLYIPGCPSHPYTNLDGFLRFLGLEVAGG